ncbi:RNA polymerase sigma-70 factor [Olivibacter ginsenosidimutans]|uniref:RNA polymerase sigma-70 factor n=1 Tax=Olivibacter ginsenosidimutans TaxID=1176537 RepID=A0ABP9C109_9SPHI
MEKIAHLTDRQLLLLINDGSQSAFSLLFRRYNRQLYTHAYHKLRDEEEAKDVVQDVFINVWNLIQRQALATDNFQGYLLCAVKNKILDNLSKKKNAALYLASLQDFIEHEETWADYPIREQQMQDQIDEAILALPFRMRAVFELSRKQHLSHKEIARQLNISHQTVTDQIKKALKILRVKLGIVLSLLFFLIS